MATASTEVAEAGGAASDEARTASIREVNSVRRSHSSMALILLLDSAEKVLRWTRSSAD